MNIKHMMINHINHIIVGLQMLYFTMGFNFQYLLSRNGFQQQQTAVLLTTSVAGLAWNLRSSHTSRRDTPIQWMV